jgi:preprotein translocase subunit SecF
METLVRHRYWWFGISLLLILPGMYFLLLHELVTTGTPGIGLHPSIDFRGGALWEYQFNDKTADQINTDEVRQVFLDSALEEAQVQRSVNTVEGKQVPAVLVRTEPLSADRSTEQQETVLKNLQAKYGNVERIRVESVGATVSQESTRSAVVAVLGACVAILLYLTVAFRKAPHPFRYGVCAILAMLHDVLVVLGVASIMGYFFNLEVDALFLTALLTIISFSVHDTIVVFDRIRENLINRRASETFDDIVNHSIVQTLPRSINTQLTTVFTLSALLLFGGASIRNFVLILLIGLISGTFSSLFNAAQLLVVWEHREWRRASPHLFRNQPHHPLGAALGGPAAQLGRLHTPPRVAIGLHGAFQDLHQRPLGQAPHHLLLGARAATQAQRVPAEVPHRGEGLGPQRAGEHGGGGGQLGGGRARLARGARRRGGEDRDERGLPGLAHL